MAIGINDISKIIEDGKALNHSIKVSDIAYVFLLGEFKEKEVAFKAIFGTTFSDSDIENYDKSAKTKFLKKYIKSNYGKDNEVAKSTKRKKGGDISFEENKEALIDKLLEIQKAKEEKLLDVKDALKLEVDIRTRLNDKFAVSDKQEEQRVIVHPKFNHICDYTHKECYLQTKAFAMEHWNLVDMEEIEREYDLVPKNIEEDEPNNETEN